MSRVVAITGMVVCGAAGLFVVGAFLVSHLALWLLVMVGRFMVDSV